MDSVPDFVVRTARRDDLHDLLSLYRELNPADPALGEDDALPAFDAMLAQPGMHVFVADVEGRAVATATLIILPNLTRSARPYGLIENVVTLASHRKQGLGHAVIRHAIDYGFAANCYKIMLLTGQKEEHVHRFYQACGFIQNKIGYQIRNV